MEPSSFDLQKAFHEGTWLKSASSLDEQIRYLVKAYTDIYGFMVMVVLSPERMAWLVRAATPLSNGRIIYNEQLIDEHSVTISTDPAGMFKSTLVAVCETLRESADQAEMEIEHQQAWEGTPV